jgi:hypothetical protein
MLFALRSGIFSREIVPSFIATLKAVVKSNFSTEVVRALATFVASFSQKGIDRDDGSDFRERTSTDDIEGDEFADKTIVYSWRGK